MLIISRKSGESFLIGDDIEITIFDTKSDKIRIGIKAPTDIPIMRKEILEICQENQRAANTSTKAKLMDLNKVLLKACKNEDI